MSTYDLRKHSDTTFLVYKDDVLTYSIDFKSKNWVCSCPARTPDCKHKKLLPPEVLVQRHEREKIEHMLKLIAPVWGSHRYEVVGSYRRGLPDSKDIDVMVLCSKEEYENLHQAFLALLFFTPGQKGDTLIRGKLYDVPIDVDRIECEEDWAPTLLYRTGPKDLNIKMRALAKNNGYTLNQHGLEGHLQKFLTEQAIFEALGMEYITPKDRK